MNTSWFLTLSSYVIPSKINMNLMKKFRYSFPVGFDIATKCLVYYGVYRDLIYGNIRRSFNTFRWIRFSTSLS